MALTVEELQIVLSCDATTAQTVLKQMEATVKAYTDKFQKYFNTSVGKVAPLDSVAKQIDQTAKRVEDGAKRIKKAYKDMSEPAYVPSGDKFVGKGGGMGDPNYFRNSEAFNMTFGNRTPNNGLLEFGAQIRAVLENSLGGVDSISKAMRMKIGDALAKLRDLARAYQEAVQKSGNDSPEASSAEQKFKNAIYAADSYIQKLDRVAAKEQEAEDAAAEAAAQEPTKFQAALSAIRTKAAAVRDAISRIGHSVKKAFQATLLGRFLKRLGSVMMRMAAMKLIRGTIDGIKKGLEELAKVSESSSKAMNTIKAASGSIKMALGAALMPVVKALAPVFVSLAGAISAAANAIARFFAVVTGQATYTAVNFGGALDGVASSAGGAGKAVKGALAAFDELVVIGNKAGGGGGGGSGVEQSLSTAADLAAVSELGTRIREAILRGDWRDVGVAVAEKFNEAINNWDAAETARKISNAIKNALDTALGFTETFDWRLLGQKIREWFENVDWSGITSRVFELLGSIFGGIGSFLAGLLLPEGELTLQGFLDGLSNFVANFYTWIKDNIFTPFINGFKKAFGIASPAKEMEGPGEMVGEGILVGISNALNRVDEIFTAFKDIINASLGIAGEYVGAFFTTLIDFIAARGEIISGNVQRFILNIKASVLEGLAGLVDNLANGPMGRLLNLIGVDLAGAAETLRGKAADARDAIGEIDDKIADAQERASNGFDISANVNTTKVDTLKTKINEAKSAISSTSSKVSDLSSNLNSLPSSKTVAVTVKVNTKGGTSTSSSGVTVSRPSVNINLDHLAIGGIAYGPTAALIGEYAGAKSNPEVVAPLSDLVGILSKAGAPQGGTSEEEMRLLREQNTLLRQIAQKELKLSPSTQLGQVVERSRQLYART